MSRRFAQTKGREAVVATMPNCDFCRQDDKATEAVYDGATQMGPWAYMCQSHFSQYGRGLGEGVGQKLFTRDIGQSECCGARVTIGGHVTPNGESTVFYICSKCLEPTTRVGDEAA